MNYCEATYFTTGSVVDISTHDSMDEILFYPSPMSDYLTIILPKKGIYDITIYDVSGNLTFESSSITNSIEIVTSQFPVGLYLINAIDNKGNIQSKKVIKQ